MERINQPGKKKIFMKTWLEIILAVIVPTLTFSSLTLAEISIESVYPNVGEVGQELSFTIRGRGFDENTRVSMSLDTANRSQIIGSMDTPGNAWGVTVVDQTAYVADEDSGLQLVDVSNPQNPVAIGSVDTPGWAWGVAVEGQTAYVADGNSGLQIVDVSDRLNPAIIGSVDTPGYAREVAVEGQIAYLADDEAGLQVIDVSDPVNPIIIGSGDTPGIAWGIVAENQIAFLADGYGGLQVIDASDPVNPIIIGSVDTPGYAYGLAMEDQTVYVADDEAGLQVVDVSEPQDPNVIGSVVDTIHYAQDVTVLDQAAYVADRWGGLQVVDVSAPSNPIIIGSVDTPGWACGVAVEGTTAYVADYYGGLQVIDVSEPQNPSIVGSVDTPGLAQDVAVESQTAYVADGSSGLQVIDVSDPRNPTIVGSVDTPGSATGVAMDGQIAYVADDEAGLQVIDASDPGNPIIIGSVDTPGWAWDIALADHTAYLADGSSGLQVVDVNDPENPIIIGSVDTPDWAQEVAVDGQTAYVADSSGGLQVIDASDLQTPIIVGSVDTPNSAEGVAVEGQTAYVVDVFDGLQVVDVEDPLNPAIIGSADTPGYAKGVTVQGRTAYVADWSKGLQAIDVNDPRNPVIVGSVDTPGYAYNLAVAGQTAYLADGLFGLTIVPASRELTQVQVIGDTEIQVILPGPNAIGHYNLRVFNQTKSDELIGAVTFLEPGDYQVLREKKAVIAVGGTGDPFDRLTVPSRTCANYAYMSLRSQGYTRETIQFLAPHLDWDVDGDGFLNDIDNTCSTATLSSVLTEWGADASELIVYLVDHGGSGTFYANASDIVQASSLAGWLDIAQDTIPGKVILIYDACYSGSFLPYMAPPAGKERIVVASCLADEPAWFMNDGVLSFSYQLWASVFLNANLYESFVTAKNMMAYDQTGVLDANGDGTQTKEDAQLVRDFLVGRGRVAASTPPVIGLVSEEQVLSETTGATFWASDISALNEIERVWAVIVPPGFENSADSEVTGLDTIELTDPDQDGVYGGAYGQFVRPGMYNIVIFASDVADAVSLPRGTTVTVDRLNIEDIVYVNCTGNCGEGHEPCHATIQQGLEETGKPAFWLKISQGNYYGDLSGVNDCYYKLSGGFDDGFTRQNGLSTIRGNLTITTGTLEIENLLLAETL